MKGTAGALPAPSHPRLAHACWPLPLGGTGQVRAGLRPVETRRPATVVLERPTVRGPIAKPRAHTACNR